MNFNNAIPPSNSKPFGLNAFDSTEAAPEYEPIPAGVYVGRVLKGEVCQTKAGADAYRLRFEITEGPHVGKTVIRTWTFSERALPYARRDLGQFGLTSSAALLSPFPPAGREYRVRLVVALWRKDDGREFNDVKKIDVIRIDESPAAAFVLPPLPPPPTAQPEEAEGDTPPGSLFRADRPGMLPD